MIHASINAATLTIVKFLVMINIMSTKKTKKNEPRVLIVDLSNVKTITGAYKEFAIAKYKMLRDVEQKIISMYTVDLYFQESTNIFYDKIVEELESSKIAPASVVEKEPVKKPNIFKRFWNWVTRKK